MLTELANTFDDVAFALDVAVNDRRLYFMHPRGDLRGTILEARDDAVVLQRVLNTGLAADMPSPHMHAKLLDEIRRKRRAFYTKLSHRAGRYLHKDEAAADPGFAAVIDGLVADIELRGLRSIFEDAVDVLDEQLLDPAMAGFGGPVLVEVLRLRDVFKLLQILTSTPGGYYNGAITPEKLTPWLASIRQARLAHYAVVHARRSSAMHPELASSRMASSPAQPTSPVATRPGAPAELHVQTARTA